jgi:aromatic ring-opening dioxygenase catalytic subunit (LigB family)
VPIVFAAAASHAPGMTAWAEAAPAEQKERLYAAYAQLRARLVDAQVEELIVLTSEHWTNFFLDHIGAFCVGRAEQYHGPVEPWLKVAAATVPGDPAFAQLLIETAYEHGVEPSFAYELEFDHGTMLPLHFLTPAMDLPVVPVLFNTLAAPQPTARRCVAFGRIIGELAARSPRRFGLLATGGMSHDPGERNHGIIDTTFDREFMARMAAGDTDRLAQYTNAEFAAAGAGAFELLSWIALAGAIGGRPGTVLAYEAVVPWATGMGMMSFAT